MPKMTISQCMDAVFQLLNQYSIAGALTPLSYNDQADDRNRMINLINDAQMQIATTSKPISKTLHVLLSGGSSSRRYILTPMPEDFMKGITVRHISSDGEITEAPSLKWLNGELALPSRSGEYLVEYARYPMRYSANTPLDTELDNTPDTHEAIPYFVAAMIALDENSRAYYALYNVWETRLSRLNEKYAYANVSEIEDVYNLAGGGIG